MLLNWVEHATPTVFAAAARTYSRLKLADRHRPIHNLIISNVPGPDFPLYFSGAELVAGFPLGPIIEGAGLNITVMSYRGVLNWGLMACRETVGGAGEIADSIPALLDDLLIAAGLGKGAIVGIAPGHHSKLRETTEPESTPENRATAKVKEEKVKEEKVEEKDASDTKPREVASFAKEGCGEEGAREVACCEEELLKGPVCKGRR